MSADTQSNGNGRIALKISVVADVAMIVAMISLAFWVGRQAEIVDSTYQSTQEQGRKLQELSSTVEKVSGQMLQMGSASSLAEVQQQAAVIDARVAAQEASVREMKSDIVTRLNRIENKLDQVR